MQLHQHNVANHVWRQAGVLAQRKCHVIEHAHVGEQGAELKQHAHAPPRRVNLLLAGCAHIQPVKQHLALRGFLLPAHQAQHRGFAAARSAHDGCDLATRHRERKIVQNGTAAHAIAELHIAQLNQRRRLLARRSA